MKSGAAQQADTLNGPHMSAAPESISLNFEKQTATCTFAHRQMGHEEEETRKSGAKYFEKEDKNAREVVDGGKLKKQVEDEEKHLQEDSILKTLGEGQAWASPAASAPVETASQLQSWGPPAPSQQRMHETDAEKCFHLEIKR